MSAAAIRRGPSCRRPADGQREAEEPVRQGSRGVRVEIGLMVPQGWKGEFDAWEPGAAWRRAIEIARSAERLGFESLWVFDHFTTVPEPTDEITFESFTMLGALAQATERARIGHMVVCTGFRNPALTAKMSSTLDVISGGRFELGIGAGWKEDEWVAYGYGFPDTPTRLAMFADHLEVITRMLGPGRATYLGQHASVQGAINVPKGIQQPRIPIVVGGNGRRVTFRLAARFADELNFVFLDPAAVAEVIPIAGQRCEEIGRDPSTLRLSLYAPDRPFATPGAERVDLLGRYAELGLHRLVAFLGDRSVEPDAQAAFAEDVRAAGIALHPAEASAY
jgi:F420-dependent oxidoreductase-like protein